uniref:Uncharacterized protein n=1 Tax=Oryza barthii TaxID=65489 RepID=A0A0D3FDC7_9ORYZ
MGSLKVKPVAHTTRPPQRICGLPVAVRAFAPTLLQYKSTAESHSTLMIFASLKYKPPLTISPPYVLQLTCTTASAPWPGYKYATLHQWMHQQQPQQNLVWDRYVMTMQLCELHELECHCSGFRTTKWTLFFVGNLGVCRCKIHVSEKCRYKMYL